MNGYGLHEAWDRADTLERVGFIGRLLWTGAKFLAIAGVAVIVLFGLGSVAAFLAGADVPESEFAVDLWMGLWSSAITAAFLAVGTLGVSAIGRRAAG